MGTEPDARLAIRTIAVSARVAVHSSKKAGRPEMAAECARRGLALLEGLRDQLGADVPEEISELLDAAVRELMSELPTGRVGEELVDDRDELVDRERLGQRRDPPRLGET